MNVKIRQEHFAALVAGKVVEGDGYRLALDDMGWEVMLQLIHQARDEQRIAAGMPGNAKASQS